MTCISFNVIITDRTSIFYQNRMQENSDASKSPSVDSLDIGLSVQSIGNQSKESQQKGHQDLARVENIHGKVSFQIIL